DWITSRRDGSQIVMEGVHPRVWLNPFHPQVQQFIVAAIAELVTNYDIDGIQLDDHFGLPVDLGYDPFTVALYRQEHGGQSPPSNSQDPAWIRWRADKITAVAAQLFHTVKALKPRCLVSLAPNPYQFSYENYLQDWATWERQGLVEELIVQIYRNDMERFVSELNAPELQAAKQHIPVAIGILTGLKNRTIPTEQIQQQVETVRSYNLAGVSFFFYETLGNRDYLFQAMFAQRASRPSITDQ
ncbi:MAG: family 10 glycosylhydrolase, partial [Cyanobacteria bacterium]|nr:family 10 glycosylhydrolase [Cyanobacteriota bacterium]MDW8201816.1 family 10 glycosylhydrolase [Cyanobacteriota bacterium SKYGB_h_bin112]